MSSTIPTTSTVVSSTTVTPVNQVNNNHQQMQTIPIVYNPPVVDDRRLSNRPASSSSFDIPTSQQFLSSFEKKYQLTQQQPEFAQETLSNGALRLTANVSDRIKCQNLQLNVIANEQGHQIVVRGLQVPVEQKEEKDSQNNDKSSSSSQEHGTWFETKFTLPHDTPLDTRQIKLENPRGKLILTIPKSTNPSKNNNNGVYHSSSSSSYYHSSNGEPIDDTHMNILTNIDEVEKRMDEAFNDVDFNIWPVTHRLRHPSHHYSPYHHRPRPVNLLGLGW